MKNIADFEEKHGQSKIKNLERQLNVERAKVAALADVQNQIVIQKSKASTIKFGLTGDYHFGSLYHNPAALNSYYEYAESCGVELVLNCGDVLAGHRVYKGQEFELRDIGFDAQIGALEKHAPRNIQTQFITGNHDASFKNLVGVSVGKAIESVVPEFVFVGEDHGRVDFETPNGTYSVMLIHPGGGSAYALCFAPDTEILTAEGWVPFPELKQGVPVATLNRETNGFEWQVPTDYTDMEYTGEMLHFNGHHYDHLVTPDHRFFARRPWDRWESCPVNGSKKNIGWQMVKARDIKGRDWVIPKACEWENGVDPKFPDNVDPLAFAELIGWYVSEGSRSKANHQIQIDQKDRGVLGHIKKLAVDCGLNPYERTDVGRIVITNREFYEWIDKYCPGKSYEKRMPRPFMDATKEFLAAFMTGYLRGDGTCTHRGWHSCTTVSKGLADDIQEIALKLGYSACINESAGVVGHKINGVEVKTARTRYQVSFNYKILEPALSTPTPVDYDGRVYCVSVPNEIIMVRRNGKCSWSGNSYRPQKIVESLEGGTKPNLLGIGHYHKAELMPSYRNVTTVQAGTFEMQTPFMARQGLAAHVGGWIIEVSVGEKANTIRSEFVAYY